MSLAKAASEAESAKGELSKAVVEQVALLEATKKQHASSAAALADASVATKLGKAKLDAAKRASASLAGELRVSRAAVSAAAKKLTGFQKGPLAAFKELKELAAPVGNDEALIANVLEKIQILPHGVLGAQMGRDGRIREHGEPDSNTVFVDPAGLHHIQPPGGPAGAGGAARAIYKFLRISRDEHFAPDIVEAVKRAGDAKYHAYGFKHAIHTVGPDLRGQYAADGTRLAEPEPPSREDALRDLAASYGNIFREFVQTELPKLWLLPVSSGIFSGSFKEEMPVLTMTALQRGFAEGLSRQQREVLLKRDLGLCIFEEKQLDDFEEALLGATGAIAVA